LSDSELHNDTTYANKAISVNKCLNKSVKNSTVKCDLINQVVTKPLPQLNLEKPRYSSLTSSKPHMNSKNQPSNMTSILMTQTTKKMDLVSTQNFIQPTLEAIPNEEEKHEIDGMFQLISFLLIL